ncbi:MAG TPA: CBS domain-containing protein [Kofleriaceae bacterium]|jgi:CBS domain-containing protein|nr:CBS domain-containing protein [Kofleriaceae bacterium]
MRTLLVSDLMSTALLTVRPGDTIERAELDMKLAGIRHFPVVDGRGRLVGVVSDRDLLRAFGHVGAKQIKIADVMTTDVCTVTEYMPAANAAATMLERRFDCLPVVGDDGRLVGLISASDFLAVAERMLSGGSAER